MLLSALHISRSQDLFKIQALANVCHVERGASVYLQNLHHSSLVRLAQILDTYHALNCPKRTTVVRCCATIASHIGYRCGLISSWGGTVGILGLVLLRKELFLNYLRGRGLLWMEIVELNVSK